MQLQAIQQLTRVSPHLAGNVLQSIVTWLRTASLELAGPLAEQTKVTNKHKVLADRYSTFVDRIQAYRRVPFPENLYARFGVKQARRSGRLRTQAAFFDPGLYRYGHTAPRFLALDLLQSATFCVTSTG